MQDEWVLTAQDMQHQLLTQYEKAQRDFHIVGKMLLDKIHPPMLFGEFCNPNQGVAAVIHGEPLVKNQNDNKSHRMDCDESPTGPPKQQMQGQPMVEGNMPLNPIAEPSGSGANEQHGMLLSHITMAINSALAKPTRECWNDTMPLQDLCLATYKEQYDLQKSLFTLDKQANLTVAGVEKVIKAIDEVTGNFQTKGFAWSPQTIRLTIMHVVTCLDKVTQECWRYHLTVVDPSFESLVNFLIERKLDATNDTTLSNFRIPKLQMSREGRSEEKAGPSNPARSRSNSAAGSEKRCSLCSRKHILKECKKFKELSNERKEVEVTRLQLCKACFSNTHNTAHCSKPACKDCSKKHHPLLHHR